MARLFCFELQRSAYCLIRLSMLSANALIVPPGKPFVLAARDTGGRSLFPDKKEARVSLRKDAAVINGLQGKL